MINFSVLMSIYSKEKPKYLIECLDSILDQSIQPTEVIIVQDGYIPISLQNVLKKYRRVLNIMTPVLKKSEGLGNALNIGLMYCNYEFILRVDADDVNLPTRFEENIKYLNQGYDLVGSYIQEFNSKKISKIRMVPLTQEEIRFFCKFRSPFNHMSVGYRKSIVLQAGGYSTDFLFKEDYHLWIKVILISKKICNIPNVLVLARFNEASLARRGGFLYVYSEYKLQKFLYNKGLSNFFEGCFYGFSRSLLFMLPAKVKLWVYKKFLRK